MAEVGLLAGLELVVRLVLVLVHVLQEVRSQGRREWMRKIGVDHNTTALGQNPVDYGTWADFKAAFEKEFIPPETQVQAIAQMYACKMGN